MKKILSAMLALALSFSLCACGNTDTNENENKNTETETTAQTESAEEKAKKTRYENANECLANYLEDGYFYVDLDGNGSKDRTENNGATEYLYKEFEALGDYEKSAEILSLFRTRDDGTYLYLPYAYKEATKYLAEYIENDSFSNTETEYLYKEFAALGDYEDSAEILSLFRTRDDGTYLYLPYAYKEATKYLAEYIENGSFRDKAWNTYSKNNALEYLYQEFAALGDYEDSAEILSRFTVLPDMLTSIDMKRTDHLGNWDPATYKSYQYDKKGTSYDDPIIIFLGLENWSKQFEFEYDADDRIISIKLTSGTKIEAIVTPEYDANGNIVKATIQTNEDTYTSTYTYDEQNRLIAEEEYAYNGGSGYDGEYWKLHPNTYIYDANGNLAERRYYVEIQNTKQDITTLYSYYENGDLKKTNTTNYEHTFNETTYSEASYEYEYDKNGYLIMEKTDRTSFIGRPYESHTVTQFIYTYDENGRIVSAELIETKNGKNEYASQILTYNYETLYFYTAE